MCLQNLELSSVCLLYVFANMHMSLYALVLPEWRQQFLIQTSPVKPGTGTRGTVDSSAWGKVGVSTLPSITSAFDLSPSEEHSHHISLTLL